MICDGKTSEENFRKKVLWPGKEMMTRLRSFWDVAGGGHPEIRGKASVSGNQQLASYLDRRLECQVFCSQANSAKVTYP